MKTLSFIDSLFIHKGMLFFVAGIIVLFFFQKMTFVKKWFEFLNTLQHELVHIFAAGFFGGIPVGLEISEKGGMAYTSKNNLIVRLAPYVVPLFSMLILGISVFLETTYKPVAFALAGLFYADYFTKTLSCLYIQPDIQKTGRLIAYPLIFCSNLFILGVIGYLGKKI